MAVDDIFELKLRSTLAAQQGLNIFHYVGLAVGTAEDLAHSFYSDVLDGITEITSSAVHFYQIDVENLNNVADFFSYFISQDGAVSGDVESPFVASTFLYGRPTTTVRNGMKRFWGVPENASADGVNRTSGYVVQCNDCQTALEAKVQLAAVDTWQPAIGHRPGPGHPDWSASKITQVRWTHFGTQNTRKVGRGQ